MSKPTLGQRAAEVVAARVGSWPFIIVQTLLLICWVAWNSDAPIDRWDVYPYILFNLLLSVQAAMFGPIIMIAQNRGDALLRETLRQIYGMSRAMVLMLEDWAACIRLIPDALHEIRALHREVRQLHREVIHGFHPHADRRHGDRFRARRHRGKLARAAVHPETRGA